MTNQEYFHSMLPKEEFERIPYLPTMGQFVDWFTKEYADMPALSDTVNTITYKELGQRVARRRAFSQVYGTKKTKSRVSAIHSPSTRTEHTR